MWYYYKVLDLWSEAEVERSVIQAESKDEAEHKINHSLEQRGMGRMCSVTIFEESEKTPDMTL